jgi:hypothetical protein
MQQKKLSIFVLIFIAMDLTIKELTKTAEMVAQIEIIRFLYPNISVEKYENYLSQMIPHNYIQIAVFENEICLGLTGCWSATKLWTGKYLEIDKFCC